MKNYLYFLIILFVFTNCKGKLKNALDLAGANRLELEKVLEYFKKDKNPLKYKAAVFLIENMPQKSYRWSEEIDIFQNYIIDSMMNYELRPKCSKYFEVNKHLKNKYVNNLIDSFERKFYKLSEIQLNEYSDIRTISADFLIENIEYAFKAWNYPWARHLCFEDFCEYILPYRYGNEKPVTWRPFFMEYFKWVLDSVKEPSNPVEVCTLINNRLAQRLYTMNGRLNTFSNSVSPKFILYSRSAISCFDLSGIGLITMRAMGIPVCLLHTTWGNFPANHTFNAVLDSNRQWLDFMSTEKSPGFHKITNYANYNPTKIYNLKFTDSKIDSYNAKLDFTDRLIPTTNLEYKLKTSNYNSTYSINIYVKKQWKNLFYIRPRKNSIFFPKMGRRNVYLITNTLTGFPSFYPTAIDSNGSITNLVPRKQHLMTLRLTRRNSMINSYYKEANDLIGIEFQGSNDEKFEVTKNLYSIVKAPDLNPNIRIELNDKLRYKFVRIFFPCINKPWVKSLTKLAFYTSINGKFQKLSGKYICSEGIKHNQAEKLFSEGMLTQLIQYEPTMNNIDMGELVFVNKSKCGESWVGIKLDKPEVISAIDYSPRTDKYFVYPDKQYELLYWDKEWISLGIRKASSYSVEFTDVPSGALYLLHELDNIQEERIFTYENEKQVFW